MGNGPTSPRSDHTYPFIPKISYIVQKLLKEKEATVMANLIPGLLNLLPNSKK